jgi:hypothetical protein
MRVISITDHFEKSPTRGGKTMLNGFDGFATPSRIFGLAFKPKKIAKKYGIFYKFASKLKRCSKLPSFTGKEVAGHYKR